MQRVGRRGEPPAYVGAFAFNFSFSVELGSGFDRLGRFLRDRITKLYDNSGGAAGDSETFAELFRRHCEEFAGKALDPQSSEETVPHSGHRIGLLDFLFGVLAGKFKDLPSPKGRFVLLFNATHLLFTGRGFAKSSDVTRLFGVFLNPEYHGAAVDIVFVTEDKGIPIEFRDRKLTSLPSGIRNSKSPGNAADKMVGRDHPFLERKVAQRHRRKR